MKHLVHIILEVEIKQINRCLKHEMATLLPGERIRIEIHYIVPCLLFYPPLIF